MGGRNWKVQNWNGLCHEVHKKLSENQVCVRASRETNIHTHVHMHAGIHMIIISSGQLRTGCLGFQQCIGLKAEDQYNIDYLCSPQGRLMLICCNVQLPNTLIN